MAALAAALAPLLAQDLVLVSMPAAILVFMLFAVVGGAAAVGLPSDPTPLPSQSDGNYDSVQ